MSERRAVLTPEEDDLEMAVVPGLAAEDRLEITFGPLDRGAVRQPPAGREPMDVRVDRKGRHLERLRHDDTGGLVSDACQRFEKLPVGDDLSPTVDDLIGGNGRLDSFNASVIGVETATL